MRIILGLQAIELTERREGDCVMCVVCFGGFGSEHFKVTSKALNAKRAKSATNFAKKCRRWQESLNDFYSHLKIFFLSFVTLICTRYSILGTHLLRNVRSLSSSQESYSSASSQKR